MATETITLPYELVEKITKIAESKNKSITDVIASAFEETTAVNVEKVLDPKEQFLQDLELKVTPSGLTGSFTTCKDAPSYGWSREEYMYMPVVADRLRAKGFRVSSSVNHGVTDWVIAR
jgi:hypothetical protein